MKTISKWRGRTAFTLDAFAVGAVGGTLMILVLLLAGCDRDQARKDRGAAGTSAAAPDPDVQQMVADVVSARESLGRIPPLTETYGAFSVEEAYVIQERLIDELIKRHGAVVGYKIGFASPDDFATFNIDEPAYGPLFESYRVEDGGSIDSDTFNRFHIENEVAFVVGRAIETPVQDVESLKPYVQSVHAGFDMADTVFDPPSAQTIPDFVANGGGAKAFVLGPAKDPREIDIDDVSLTVERNGERLYEGPSTAVMESPWNVLLFLANDLIQRGHALQAGDVVLTGKVAPAVVREGDAVGGTYTGSAGPLGEVSVTVQ